VSLVKFFSIARWKTETNAETNARGDSKGASIVTALLVSRRAACSMRLSRIFAREDKSRFARVSRCWKLLDEESLESFSILRSRADFKPGQSFKAVEWLQLTCK